MLAEMCIKKTCPLMCDRSKIKPYLVGVHKDDLVQIQREQDIQEQDLVSPDDSLLLCLGTQPMGPVVCDEFIVKVVFLCHMRNKILSQDVHKVKECC